MQVGSADPMEMLLEMTGGKQFTKPNPKTLLKSETITGETIRVDSGRHLAGPGIAG